MQRKGRPAFYQTPEEMQIKIDEYFKSCEGELLRDAAGNAINDKNGRPVYIKRRTPSITGLAHYLGFADRRTFIRYKKRPAFTDTVLVARLRVEEALEELLFYHESAEGAKFALVSNFGWSYKPKQPNDRPPVQFIDQSKQKRPSASCDPAQPATDAGTTEERGNAAVSC